MSIVSNKGPEKVAVDVLNTRVTVVPAADSTAGKTACPFETRVVQESGTH